MCSEAGDKASKEDREGVKIDRDAVYRLHEAVLAGVKTDKFANDLQLAAEEKRAERNVVCDIVKLVKIDAGILSWHGGDERDVGMCGFELITKIDQRGDLFGIGEKDGCDRKRSYYLLHLKGGSADGIEGIFRKTDRNNDPL